MKQKGKADAPEEQGKMSREFVYLLASQVIASWKAEREGFLGLLTKDGLEKEHDSVREEELQHKLGGR